MGKKFNKKKSVSTSVDPRMLHLSYLNQAARLMSAVSPALSRNYTVAMRDVAERNVLRMDRPIKHQYCRRCSSFYVPGLNSKIRVDEVCEMLRMTCEVCGAVRLRHTNTERSCMEKELD
eukprot:Selendium_serpulae@DN6227_c0_g1_i4.p1